MTTFTQRLPRTIPHLRKANDSFFITLQFPSSLLYHHRQASTTTTTTTTSPKPSPTSHSKINGPPSTLPAPLTVPTRSASQSLPSHLFSIGKTYATFYKTGVKNIYTNFQLSRPIQARIDSTHHGSLSQAINSNSLSRHDLQLLVRNWHDLKRIPIFALVFAVCGEFTPLVVVLVSNVVPWTCRIPKQVRSDRGKLEGRRGISFRNLTVPPPLGRGVDGLHRMQLLHVSWSLGLSSSAWDYLGGRLPGLPTWILRRKVRRRVEYLGLDDELIKKGGGVRFLELEELRMACVERGIDVLDRSGDALKSDLNNWLKSAEKVSIEHLLLTRPSVWPVKSNEETKLEERKKASQKIGEPKFEARKKVHV